MTVIKNTFEADVSSYERALRKLEEAERKIINTATTGAKTIETAHKKTASSAKEAGQKTKTAFKEAKTEAGSLTTAINKIGARLLAAFAIERVLTFFATTTREMVSLALKVQPVRKAFERVADPKLLDGLRRAVRGTVSDLELMAQAVKAENLEIPIEKLATLFEFAQRRARETGEEVQFLVDSIVAGIGRRSPLVLDNLGISAVRLRGKLKGVGIETATIAVVTEAVSEIVQEEMAEMGDAVESHADKVDKAAASYDNLLTKIGESLIPIVGDISTVFTEMIDVVATDGIPVWQKFAVVTGSAHAQLFIAQNRIKEINKALEDQPIEEAQQRWEDFARVLQQTLGLINEELPDTNIIDPLFDLENVKTIAQFEERIKALKKVIVNTDPELDKFATTVAFLSGVQEQLNEITGRSTEAEKQREAALKALADAQDEANKRFKEGQKALDKQFNEAMRRANKEIKEFIRLTKEANKESSEFFQSELNLLIANNILEAKINKNEIELENANFQKRLESLKLNADSQGQITEESQRAIELLTREHEQKLTDITDKGIEERQRKRDEDLQLILDTTSQVFGAIAEFSALRHNAELDQIRERTSAEMDSFDMREGRLERELELDLARLERNDISEQKRSEAENILLSQFDTRIEAEKQGLRDLEAERKAVQIRAAQDAKALAIFEAIINVAKAITAAGVTTPTAITAGILGAIQIALIEAQPIPSFKEGVIDFKGLGSTKSDSNVVRISNHESIINAAGTHAYPNILLAANNLTLPALIDKEFVQPAVKQAVTDIWPMVAATNKDKNHHVIISNTKEMASANADQQFVNEYLNKG